MPLGCGRLTLTRIEGRPAVSALVTGNFFQVLGVQAALGRPLLPGDDERFAGRPVIVLSHAGWRKLFRGDQGVIGRRVVINGAPYEIVGVMPDGFRGLGITPPDYWAPLALAGQFRDASEGPENKMEVVGRLKPGLSPEAATAALAAWASGRTDLAPSRASERQASTRTSDPCLADTAPGHCSRGMTWMRCSSSLPCSSPSG